MASGQTTKEIVNLQRKKIDTERFIASYEKNFCHDEANLLTIKFLY
jgi:hypothetical protein